MNTTTLRTRYPEIGIELTKALESSTRGDSESLILCTSKNTYKLARDLTRTGYEISPKCIGKLFKTQGYSLNANCKKLKCDQLSDRGAQLTYINSKAKIDHDYL